MECVQSKYLYEDLIRGHESHDLVSVYESLWAFLECTLIFFWNKLKLLWHYTSTSTLPLPLRHILNVGVLSMKDIPECRLREGQSVLACPYQEKILNAVMSTPGYGSP